MIRSKVCTRCKLTKVLDCFGTVKIRTGRGHKGPFSPKVYYRSHCRDCHRLTAKESQRRLYAENPRRFLEVQAEWRRKNRAKFLKAHYQYRDRIRECVKEEELCG